MSEDPFKGIIDELRARVSQMLKGLDQDMPIAATVAFMVKKEKEENFIRNSDKLTDGTRRLPGCNLFAYHERRPVHGPQWPSDSVEYLIYEDWESGAKRAPLLENSINPVAWYSAPTAACTSSISAIIASRDSPARGSLPASGTLSIFRISSTRSGLSLLDYPT